MNTPEIKWNQLERNLWAAPPGENDWMLYTKYPQHLWATSDKLLRCEVLGTNLINKHMPMPGDFSTFNMCVLFSKIKRIQKCKPPNKDLHQHKNYCKIPKIKVCDVKPAPKMQQQTHEQTLAKCMLHGVAANDQTFSTIRKLTLKKTCDWHVIDWCQFRAGNTSCTNLQGFRQRGRSLLQPHGRQHP